MEIKKLKTKTLQEALMEIKIGETYIAPDGYSKNTITKTCSSLKNKGYIFQTSKRAEIQTITRLK